MGSGLYSVFATGQEQMHSKSYGRVTTIPCHSHDPTRAAHQQPGVIMQELFFRPHSQVACLLSRTRDQRLIRANGTFFANSGYASQF